MRRYKICQAKGPKESSRETRVGNTACEGKRVDAENEAGQTTFELAITQYTSFSLTITGDLGSQLDLFS